MRQKAKKNAVRYMVRVLLIIVVAITTIMIIAGGVIRKLQIDYEKQIHQNEEIIRQNTRTVYVAVRKIRTGEPVEETMLEVREAVCSQKDELLFSGEDIGKKAVVDIAEGTYMLKDLVNRSEGNEEFREICYQSIQLTGNLQNYDVVDIRIRYPNGEDYIVLTGKNIRLDEENYGRCYLQLTEEEILMMSAAMYDGVTYPGTEIYASKYIEPARQTKSVVTYLPSAELIKIMMENPNISEMTTGNPEGKRVELEMRMKEKFYE